MTPFAPRALDRGLSAVLASLVRHENPDWNAEPSAQVVDLDDPRVAAAIEWVAARGSAVTARGEVADEVHAMADHRRDAWAARKTRVGTLLSYSTDRDATKPLLAMPTGSRWQLWTAPMSLRDVEPNVNLVVDERDDSIGGGPSWETAPPAPTPSPVDEDATEMELEGEQD